MHASIQTQQCNAMNERMNQLFNGCRVSRGCYFYLVTTELRYGREDSTLFVFDRTSTSVVDVHLLNKFV